MNLRKPDGPPGVAILGTGMAVPSRTITNAELAQMVDTSDEWITQRTGIKTRHIVDRGTKTSDLAAQAAQVACERAGIEPSDLDLLLCATMTQDMVCPATACQVVAKIGAVPCGAFDINIACTGFVAGLNLGSNYITAGHARRVAVVAADTLSSIVNWQDRRTCILFGDAASCAILSASDNPNQGSLYQHLGSNGDMGVALYVPKEESDIPDKEREHYSGKLHTLQMNGKAVYKFAVPVLAQSVEKALSATGLTSADIKMVVAHQSNIRMLESSWKRLGFGREKVHINLDRYGNTSAASVGICLHELVEAGQLVQGDRVIFVAQGGGLSWGANLWQL